MPGEIVAQRHGAICRATVDGAVWITHLKRPAFKLPAARALALAGHALDVPELPAPLHAAAARRGHLPRDRLRGAPRRRLPALRLLQRRDEHGPVPAAARRLPLRPPRRATRVIVLMGGADFFSNGIHLNVIEAADDPAAESWSNLHAIDDVVREVIETDSQLVVSALTGDAAAGGVPFALAADHVLAREDVVLNPYYGHMGGLYGSEYWTYLLPRRVGAEMTAGSRRARSSPSAHARRGRDRAARRRLRRHRRPLPRRRAPLAERLARDPRLPRCWPTSGAPARATSHAAARRLPRRGARAIARVLLRRRPQLPRGAPALRAQARGPCAVTTPAVEDRPAAIGSARAG